MELLVLYVIFALTTAIFACMELLYPVLRYRKSLKHKVEYELVHYLAFFCIILLGAPLVLPSCVVPSWSLRFRAALYTGIFPVDVKI